MVEKDASAPLPFYNVDTPEPLTEPVEGFAMRHVVIAVSLLLLIAGTTAWWLFGNPPLEQRAFGAYQAGKYAEALPLLKKLAEVPGVFNNKDARNTVLMAIVDTQNHLAGIVAPPTAVPPYDLTSAAAGPSQQVIIANPQSLVASNNGGAAPGDPSKGPDRIIHKRPGPGEMATMTIKELGNFQFNPETDTEVPADVMALEGAKVRLPGFMLPISQTEKVTDFALVPSLMGCCFGQPPGVEHIITARTPANQAVDYTVDEIWVEGILHVRVQRKENFTFSIFELDVTSVKLKE